MIETNQVRMSKGTFKDIAQKISEGHKNEIRYGILIGERVEDAILITGVVVPKQEPGDRDGPDLDKHIYIDAAIEAHPEKIVGIIKHNADKEPNMTDYDKLVLDEFAEKNTAAIMICTNNNLDLKTWIYIKEVVINELEHVIEE